MPGRDLGIACLDAVQISSLIGLLARDAGLFWAICTENMGAWQLIQKLHLARFIAHG